MVDLKKGVFTGTQQTALVALYGKALAGRRPDSGPLSGPHSCRTTPVDAQWISQGRSVNAPSLRTIKARRAHGKVEHVNSTISAHRGTRGTGACQ